MSGLLALLDDVAAIAKVAAASVDDVAGMAAKAGTKAAGVVIDDAAVTPKYVHGFEARRELPIIWKITKGSLFNKIVILLPLALLLNAFAPWAVTPLLMIGGAYLCFEGAEKVFHRLFPHADAEVEADLDVKDPAHLEEERVRGAIKTDFVLSAEIIVISLGTVAFQPLHIQFGVLAVIAVLMTVGVYGLVAAIVKLDDLGLHLSREGAHKVRAMLGRGILTLAPLLMKFLSVAGTVAMFLVGGGILVHGIPLLHHLVQTHADDLLGWLGVALFNIAAGMTAGIILVACTFVLTRIRKGLRRAPA